MWSLHRLPTSIVNHTRGCNPPQLTPNQRMLKSQHNIQFHIQTIIPILNPNKPQLKNHSQPYLSQDDLKGQMSPGPHQQWSPPQPEVHWVHRKILRSTSSLSCLLFSKNSQFLALLWSTAVFFSSLPLCFRLNYKSFYLCPPKKIGTLSPRDS